LLIRGINGVFVGIDYHLFNYVVEQNDTGKSTIGLIFANCPMKFIDCKNEKRANPRIIGEI
jgi:hypothetical protein